MDTLQSNATKIVLLAEDDVLMRMPLAEYLRGCGYKVIEASSADEAIDVLDDDTFAPDVVLTVSSWPETASALPNGSGNISPALISS